MLCPVCIDQSSFQGEVPRTLHSNKETWNVRVHFVTRMHESALGY